MTQLSSKCPSRSTKGIHIIHRAKFSDGQGGGNRLVGGRVRELRRGKADLVVRSVEHREVALKEAEPVDEVQALARLRTDVADDEVDLVALAADKRVQGTLKQRSTIVQNTQEPTALTGQI